MSLRDLAADRGEAQDQFALPMEASTSDASSSRTPIGAPDTEGRETSYTKESRVQDLQNEMHDPRSKEMDFQDAETVDPYDPLKRHLPVLLRPAKESSQEGVEAGWMPDQKMASRWMGIFYDLAFVATLTAFTEVHAIGDWTTLLNFFGFFVLLWWSWFAQVNYDIHFETEDLAHRFFKLLQLCGLGYLAGATGGWDLSKIQQSDDVFADGAGDRYQAHTSFVTVASAYAGLRSILIVQYILVYFLARKRRQPYLKRTFLTPIAYNAASCIVVILAATLNSHSQALVAAKITCLFLSVTFEVIGILITSVQARGVGVQSARLAERLGNLTLIVLGEGFLGVFKGFNRAILGFSKDNIDVYISVFCCIIILCCLYDFCFTGFEVELRMSKRRLSAWAILHFPLHFCLFAFLSGLTNATVASAFIEGALYGQASFLVPAAAAAAGNTSVFRELAQDQNLILQISSLKLTPSYREELDLLDNKVQVAQYASQILFRSADIYVPGDSSQAFQDTYSQLQLIETDATTNATLSNERATLAGNLYLKLWTILVTQQYQGIGWIFPSAGLVLILISIRNITHCHWRPGPMLRLLEYSQLTVGFALGILGLLNIGKSTVDFADNIDGNFDRVSPIYVLISYDWLIPIITIVYFVLMAVHKVILALRKRRLQRSLR